MGYTPFRFYCENCGHETYIDSDICKKCEEELTMKPIPKSLYKCYLNGRFYGGGDLKYMHELFKDYVLTREMYGKQECDFKIVREDNP